MVLQVNQEEKTMTVKILRPCKGESGGRERWLAGEVHTTRQSFGLQLIGSNRAVEISEAEAKELAKKPAPASGAK